MSIRDEPPARRASYFRPTPPAPLHPVCLSLDELRCLHVAPPARSVPVEVQRVVRLMAHPGTPQWGRR